MSIRVRQDPSGDGGCLPREALEALGVRGRAGVPVWDRLPFVGADATAGVENELQAVVAGDASRVDLPLTIRGSNYFANCRTRRAAGTIARSRVSQLERYLDENPHGVWENSWIRFPASVLSSDALAVLERDLLADKRDPAQGERSDLGAFRFTDAGETWLRLPVSYLIKLALADVLGTTEGLPSIARQTGRRLLDHFSNDNTSPETHSFHLVSSGSAGGLGEAAARETATRFLLTQLLTLYANDVFRLSAHGQQAMVYCAPHPPVRQKELNDCVSDAFYRSLFMSPCLSGWDQGEAKHRYMHLCHQVLSRSQVNAVVKLREAGIITDGLVVLPGMSNISLANNGTHVSLGSRMLSRALGDAASGFGPGQEKAVGDLAIKIVEHFLPLFVGTYSAALYRFDFVDFRPERMLGFLPHELDYTHLRMLWRRWRGKARCRFLKQPITPFGLRWFDQAVAVACRLRGDLVPDFRLIDYFVALLSTDQSPGLDGRLGNGDRLKRDLTDLGVFDSRLALYLPYRLREQRVAGFSGFEGRITSLFEGFSRDLGEAVDLQRLITALAFQYMASGEVGPADIPDNPTAESERRQAFFGAAIGLPVFYVHAQSRNRLLRRILQEAHKVRPSRRYPGYLRVRLPEYRRALLRVLRLDAGDLIETLGVAPALDECARRLDVGEGASVAERLLRAILDKAGAKTPWSLDARQFNLCAEAYYREELRRRQTAEALEVLEETAREMGRQLPGTDLGSALCAITGGNDAAALVAGARRDVLEDRASPDVLRRLIALLLLGVAREACETEDEIDDAVRPLGLPAPVHRAA